MKKKTRRRKLKEKLIRALFAETNTDRANYAIDILTDELLQNPALDELLYAVVEVGLGKKGR